jgi:predicted transcriptional regulator
MYNLPQEIEVWYIIPAIRKELAKILTEEYGLTQEKAANILGVSKAAVCQYLGKKRAINVKFPLGIKKEMTKSAKILVDNPKLALREILRLLAAIKKMRCSCEICKRYNKGILALCQMKPLTTGEM